jgi:hypothetical protein
MSVTAPLTVPVPVSATFAALYRILTERSNLEQVECWLIAHGFDYTIFTGNGAWRGARENSMAIELATVTKEEATSVALSIKEMNGQEEIIVQELPILTMFI